MSGFANRHTEGTAQIVRRDFVTEGGENGGEHAEYVLWDAEEGREVERRGVWGGWVWRDGGVRKRKRRVEMRRCKGERESRKTGAGGRNMSRRDGEWGGRVSERVWRGEGANYTGARVLEYVQCTSKLCMQVSRGSGHRTRDGGGNNRAQVSPGSTKDGRY